MIVRIGRRHNRSRCSITAGSRVIARGRLGGRMQHRTALRSIIKLARCSWGIAGSCVISQLIRARGRDTGIALKLTEIRRSALSAGSRFIAIVVATELGRATPGAIVIIVPPEFRGGRAILIVGFVTTTVTFVFATVSTATIFVVSALESVAAPAIPVTIGVVAPVSTKRSSAAAAEVASSTAPSSAYNTICYAS